jgi:hypothetical protein
MGGTIGDVTVGKDSHIVLHDLLLGPYVPAPMNKVRLAKDLYSPVELPGVPETDEMNSHIIPQSQEFLRSTTTKIWSPTRVGTVTTRGIYCQPCMSFHQTRNSLACSIESKPV